MPRYAVVRESDNMVVNVVVLAQVAEPTPPEDAEDAEANAAYATALAAFQAAQWAPPPGHVIAESETVAPGMVRVAESSFEYPPE